MALSTCLKYLLDSFAVAMNNITFTVNVAMNNITLILRSILFTSYIQVHQQI